MRKSLLVLAASTYQVPVIETAKALGYRVITTDNVPSNPGHVLADVHYAVDTTDYAEVLALARKENISGIISPGTDVAVFTAAYVAGKCGLPGPSPESARTMTNKLHFREFMAAKGFAVPEFFAVVDNELPMEKTRFDGCEWIIKPSCSSGSKGIFIVCSPEDFSSCVAQSRNFSVDGTAILEAFIKGTQHTLEGILQDGKIGVSLLTDRDTVAAPYTTTTGHRFPSRLPESVQIVVRHVIEAVLRKFGIDSGVFDCDFVVDDECVTLIEITPRLGGNSLSRLFKTALNFDLAAFAVAYACSDHLPVLDIPACTPQNSAAIVILGVERAGRLSWNEQEVSRLRQEAWVRDLRIDVPYGEKVMPFINGRNRIGEALVTGSNRDDLDARLTELHARLALAVG
ncbi:MAG: ATP-grasp domain-containing protein [Burkholderiales bacterium]|jgi:biotin carboxylase|nr:ATP-grasp domain-containing protein [Burkholderiales bacterium]